MKYMNNDFIPPQTRSLQPPTSRVSHGCPAAVDLVPILIRNDDSLFCETKMHGILAGRTQNSNFSATLVCDGIGTGNARTIQPARFAFQIMSFGYLHCFLVRSTLVLCHCHSPVHVLYIFYFFFSFSLVEKLNLYLCVHDWRSDCATVSRFIASFGKLKRCWFALKDLDFICGAGEMSVPIE